MIKRFSRNPKLIILLAFVLFISLTLAACDSSSSTDGTSPDPETYQLSFDYLGEGDLPELDGEYDEDSSVEISADPEEGWEFYKWEGEGVQNPEESSTSVLVSSDQDIKAIFIEEYDGDANYEGYAGWEGNEDKPFLIKNAVQLDNIRNEMESHFILIEDIDLKDFNTWEPIGNHEDSEEYEGFSGTLDGRNYAIENLVIEKLQEDNNYVGLFRIIENGTIQNLNIIDANVKGDYNTGILAGINGFLNEATGVIDNVKTSGKVNGIWSLGGLVGRNAGTIENSSSYAIIKTEDETEVYANIGGLVGINFHGENSSGIIKNSYAKGEVHSQNRHIGGLVGISLNENSIIEDSYSDISINGGREVGGLVGAIYQGTEIKNSYAEGNIKGSSNIGGLIGYMHEGIIENSYATGNSEGDYNIGGLVGENDNGIIETSFATGNVNAEGYYFEQPEDYFANAGGLVGQNEGEIKKCYSTGDVSDTEDAGGVNLGGFVGRNREPGVISESFSTGKVTSHYNTGQVGGFVGSNYHTIQNSYWDINTSGYDNSAGGEGRTTEQMQAGTANDQIDGENIYEDWDDNIWDFGSANEYPGFYWE